MEHVLIERGKLLIKLRENRENHRRIFEDALEGWKERVLEQLETALEDAKAGRKFITHINLPQPIDHTAEYDNIISQIEWHEEDQIELDLRSFNQFILDDWGWKADFLQNATMYAKSLDVNDFR